MNDQTAKADAGKAPLSLVPRRIIFDIARIREYGNQKYGDPDNWKNVEVERYRDAAFRHLLAYLDDPYGIDEESGLPHYWHLACNVAFICEMEDKKPCSPGYSPSLEVKEYFVKKLLGGEDIVKHVPDFSDLDEEADLDAMEQQKIGHWIIDGHHIECDQCGSSMCRLDEEGDPIPTDFCPSCGVPMEDPGFLF
jgi:hypothetical protein